MDGVENTWNNWAEENQEWPPQSSALHSILNATIASFIDML